jgi:hypothetical protein
MIEVPVEPILCEGDDRVRLAARDRRHDLIVQLVDVLPPQLAVRMVEDQDLRDAQHLCGLAQLVLAHPSEIAIRDQRRVAD